MKRLSKSRAAVAGTNYSRKIMSTVMPSRAFPVLVFVVFGICLLLTFQWTVLNVERTESSSSLAANGINGELVQSLGVLMNQLENGDIEGAKGVVSNLLQSEKVDTRMKKSNTHVETKEVDPLSEECFLDTYPTEPLTIETANLCDPIQQPTFQDSWSCPEDPTCRACKVDYIQRYTELQRSWREPERQSRRTRSIKNRFSMDHPVVVSALGLDAREFTYIIAADKVAHNYLTQQGFLQPEPSYLSSLSFELTGEYRGKANTGDHATINNYLLLATIDIVLLGYKTLLHDVDIAWKSNPLPYLVEAVKRRDFVAMEAPRKGAQGPINSGFVFINPTIRSKVLLQSMENLAGLKKKQDQILWNTVIKIPRLSSQLSYRVLSLQDFRKTGATRILRRRFESKPASCLRDPEDYFIFHVVGNHKKPKLIEQGLWYFVDGVCAPEPCRSNCGDILDTSFLKTVK